MASEWSATSETHRVRPVPRCTITRSDVVVGRNFAALGLGDGLARLIAFGATVYLARVLGADGYGVVALALGVTLYSQQLVDYGVEALGIRRVAADRGHASELAGAYLTGRLLLALTVLVTTAVVATWVLPDPEGPVLALYALTLFPVALSTKWVHVGFERAQPVGAARVIGESVMIGVILLLVRGLDDIRTVPLAQFIGDALAMSWLFMRLRDHGLKVRLGWDGPRIREMARSALPLVGHSLLGLVIYNSDLIFLRIFRGPGDVGLYAVAYTLISFLLNLGWAYSQSLLPTLARLEVEGTGAGELFRSAQAQVFVITAPLAVGGWLVAEPLITSLFSEEYLPAGAALAVLIWSVPVSLVRSVSLAALLARERQDLVLRTTTSSAVVNLLLNVILIPRFGILGAAYATVATELMRAGLALLFTRQEGYPGLALLRFVPSLLGAAVMAGVVLASAGMNVWMRIALGAAAYALSLVAFGGVKIRGGLRLTV